MSNAQLIAMLVAGSMIIVMIYLFKEWRKTSVEEGGKDAGELGLVNDGALMNDAEEFLYERLQKALPGFKVYPHIAACKLLRANESPKSRKRNTQAQPVVSGQHSIDFLVCTDKGRAIVAVQMNDASHRLAERKLLDEKEDGLLRSAGLRVLRFPLTKIPKDDVLLAFVEKAVKPVDPLNDEDELSEIETATA